MSESVSVKRLSPIVANTTIEEVITRKSNVPLIVVLCPSYEDRARAIALEIQKIPKTNRREIAFLLICLKNKKNNDMLLEDLKDTNIRIITQNLDISDENIEWIEYPENFSVNALKKKVESKLHDYFGENGPADILFDISTMPRSIIFHMCEHILTFIHLRIIGRICFSYSEPEEYSKVHYAQDIGTLKGLFSGLPLDFDNNQSIHAVIFPCRAGHEGKLLCDSLDNLNRSPSYNIYFPIHTTEFNTSLELMRANQSLIDREAYNNYYYCTIEDAIKELDDYFNKEILNLYNLAQQGKAQPDEKMTKQTYLVAPFSSKVFMPVAYFELQRLKRVAPSLADIEICHVKGFQYTSVYSIGIGKISCFELEANKLYETPQSENM